MNKEEKMPRMRPPKGYYTLTEATKKLNLSSAMVRKHVEKGRISYLLPKGREHGFYLKEDVDKLASELETFLDLRETAPSTFGRATREDIPKCAEVYNITIRPAATPIETKIRWFERNPNTFFVLKKEEDVIGYICILPLKDFQTVEGLLNDNKLNMIPEDIAEPDTEDPIHLYIMTMVVKAGFSHLEKRTYGSRLISGLTDIIVRLGQEGIEIKTIAARSETPDGIRLMRKLGFTELPPSGRKRKFIVDVENSGIPTIMQYKQALKENQKNSKDQRLKVEQKTVS